MAKKSPKQNMIDLSTVLEAVRELAPEKVFGGIPLADYDSIVQEAVDVRTEHVNAEINVSNLANKRDNIDERALKMRELIVNGIIGDPEFGPDSTLYERCGYIRKSNRKSGLTRKATKKPE
ncbi:MAG TPA: hypothetical protein PKY82_05420 [Pyrinomonadaceae bacterium]|nr:hypothetical protein [Pyrinomonadaceae bacterium]